MMLLTYLQTDTRTQPFIVKDKKLLQSTLRMITAIKILIDNVLYPGRVYCTIIRIVKVITKLRMYVSGVIMNKLI